ncbi:MAG: hypothetical protein AAF721_08775 [Myxococcota bacterium]
MSGFRYECGRDGGSTGGWLRSGLIACLALAGAGCVPFFGHNPDDGGPTRCEQDRYECQDIQDVPAAACQGEAAEGEDLVVEIGTGMSDYDALGSGEPLTTYAGGGGFQGPGVEHAGVALRISGASLSDYDVLGARISVFESAVCMTMDDGSRLCDGVPWIADRSVLLGDGPALNVVEGVIEEFGLTMPIEPLGAGTYVVQAVVEDPCGRVGVAHHDYSL